MQPFPELSPEARQVLEIIMSHTAIDGSTLMKHLGMSRAADVIKPIRELQQKRLIEVGGTLTPDSVPFARIGVLPSAKDYLSSMLR